jgi:SOS-response transcriptional repressor LexA
MARMLAGQEKRFDISSVVSFHNSQDVVERSGNAAHFFAMDVNTSIMAGAGIQNGDTLVVDRMKAASNECIVIAELAGELLVRQFKMEQGKKWLVAPGAGVATIEITGYEIWGVVDHLLRKMS